MGSLFTEYPYLWTNLTTLVLVHLTARLLLSPRERRLVFYSGLANAPGFGFLIFLENEYWSPVRLGGLLLGIEDVLCSYDVSALCWLLITVLNRHNLRQNGTAKKILERYLKLAGLLVALFLLGLIAGLRGMTSLLATQLIALPLLLYLGRTNWRQTLQSLVAFPIVYAAIVSIYFRVWPDFLGQWNLQGPWGGLVMGLPLGEIVWSLGFALWWPPFFTFVLGLEFTSPIKDQSPDQPIARKGGDGIAAPARKP